MSERMPRLNVGRWTNLRHCNVGDCFSTQNASDDEQLPFKMVLAIVKNNPHRVDVHNLRAETIDTEGQKGYYRGGDAVRLIRLEDFDKEAEEFIREKKRDHNKTGFDRYLQGITTSPGAGL